LNGGSSNPSGPSSGGGGGGGFATFESSLVDRFEPLGSGGSAAKLEERWCTERGLSRTALVAVLETASAVEAALVDDDRNPEGSVPSLLNGECLERLGDGAPGWTGAPEPKLDAVLGARRANLLRQAIRERHAMVDPPEVQQAARAAEQSRRKPPCRFFQLNKCRMGGSCPFSHDSSDPSGGSGAGGEEALAPLCRFFAGPAGCRFGHACHFRHALDASSPGPASGLGALPGSFPLAADDGGLGFVGDPAGPVHRGLVDLPFEGHVAPPAPGWGATSGGATGGGATGGGAGPEEPLVLLLGEGDLGYAAACAPELKDLLLATTLEPLPAAARAHPGFAANLAAVRRFGGAAAGGVDATKLALCLAREGADGAQLRGRQIGRVVMNFPVAGVAAAACVGGGGGDGGGDGAEEEGEAGDSRRQRLFLASVFKQLTWLAAAGRLSGEVKLHLRLSAGQLGKWRVLDSARRSLWALESVMELDPEDLGYLPATGPSGRPITGQDLRKPRRFVFALECSLPPPRPFEAAADPSRFGFGPEDLYPSHYRAAFQLAPGSFAPPPLARAAWLGALLKAGWALDPSGLLETWARFAPWVDAAANGVDTFEALQTAALPALRRAVLRQLLSLGPGGPGPLGHHHQHQHQHLGDLPGTAKLDAGEEDDGACCPVCLETPLDPERPWKCCHVVCGGCMADMEAHELGETCPLCRADIEDA